MPIRNSMRRSAAGQRCARPCRSAPQWRSARRVHVGDVLIEGDHLLGDGVNIAARLEEIAEPGGVCVSGNAFEHVRGRIEAEFADLGEKALKNIARPVRVYAVALVQDAPPAVAPGRASPPRLSLVVLPFTNIGGSAEQEYFVDGVTESLTTDLSRIRGALVIARNTAFAYKGMRAGLALNPEFTIGRYESALPYQDFRLFSRTSDHSRRSSPGRAAGMMTAGGVNALRKRAVRRPFGNGNIRFREVTSRSQRDDGFRADSGPSRGDGGTRAIRPIQASKAAVCYVRNTSAPAVRCAQIAVIRRRLGERVKSTLSRPSRASL